MTSSGQGQNDVIMTSPGSSENSSRFNYRVIIRVGSGQNSGRIGSKFGPVDDIIMTSANSYRTETRRLELRRACPSLAVASPARAGAWRHVRPPPASCHPSIFSFRRVDSKYAIIFNFHQIKNVETGQKPLGKTNKKTFFFFYVLILIYGKL